MSIGSKKDAIFVNNPDVLEELILSSTNSQDQKYIKQYWKTNSNNNFDLNKIKQQEDEIKKDNDILTLKNIRKNIEKKANLKYNKFLDLLNNIEESKHDLIKIDKEVQIYEENKLGKMKRLFDDWNLNVHSKIQENISQQVNKMDSKELHNRKLIDYEKYINITNTKEAIFNDIIIESEYDPLEPNRRCIKAKISRLNDPTKLNEIKADIENSMLDPNFKSKKKTESKYTLPIQHWAKGKIEATPYGMPPKEMSSMSQRRTHSNIIFDHFNYPTKNDYINNEFPIGKRMVPK